MDKEKKEKRKRVANILKKWGSGSMYVKEKAAEYQNIQQLYENGKNSRLIPEAELFGYRSMAEQVFRDVRDYMYEKSKTEEMLDKLDAIERCIIVCRYIKKIKWDAVPAHMPAMMSERQCYRIHNEALDKLAELMENESTENDNKET